MKYAIAFLLLAQIGPYPQPDDSVKKQEILIEAQEHTPVIFQFDMTPKEGWETTDKVHPLNVEWKQSDKLSYRILPGGNIACWAPPGNHSLEYKQILINWTKQDIDQREFIASIKIIAVNPDPDPDPDPTPDPTPDPDPIPPVADNPFPTGVGQNRVLIVEDSDARNQLPAEQRNILGSIVVRNELNKFREWRLLDFRTTFQMSDSYWKKAIETYKAKHPSTKVGVVITNGVSWEATPLPSNETAMLALLQKYL